MVKKDKVGNRHTLMHPAIAMNFASWLSVEHEADIILWALELGSKEIQSIRKQAA